MEASKETGTVAAPKMDLTLKIYNSMTQQKELFTPIVPGKVGIYLEHLKCEVTYVRNFTDVDDKIIRRANDLGENPLSLSNRYCQEYLVDMADLQCLPPTYQPRVSDHMEQIKDMITQIINNDCAYVVEGDVFFAVEKSPNYGRLSGQRLENNRAGERVAVDSRKRNPADFALWKAAKAGEPSWDSPWGPGRPGWHIECSAMSAHYLSSKFDIHGGGIDLIFPHHENEIAQSCAACQDSNVSYWMHNGHVTNNNEKMSKSLGNFFTIRQITERYHPLALRHFLISAHYRSPLNYSVLQLDSASDAVFYIYQTLQDCEVALSPFQEHGKTARINPAAEDCINKLRDEFHARMSDDLNTSHILTGAFQDALKFINSSLNMLKKKQPKQQQLSLIESLRKIENEVKEVLRILGLLPPGAYSELKDKALKRAELTEEDVLQLIEERAAARKNKDFSKSDQIRADLTRKGIALMDMGKETIWRPCVPVEQEQEAPPAEKEKKPAATGEEQKA
ncbi:cysteine--tRNA ligase 2 cytoplasmic [Citrus sinensis]|uniref:Cysteine--tRNA ligase 2 cytoplasmic n=1 Tax=Citrus sinensis TaxID=2711 RepID=A0ACB8NC11_CITSI|nr:cysteine--tRNA ligase 2 cytoplasmic [Citrus sinensis]